MNKISLIIALLILLNACKTKENTQTTTNLEGHWLNKEYLESLTNTHSPRKVADNLTFYATELLIDKQKGDSIGVFNGQVEFAFLPYKRNGDSLKVKLNQAPQTNIIYSNTDKTISFVDAELNRTFTFVKADANLIDRTYTPSVAFPTAVNKALLAGTWNVVENNNNKTIEFLPNGQIKDWDRYDAYTICVNGDCMQNQDGDVIFLESKGISISYAFTHTGDDVVFYQLKSRGNNTFTRGEAVALLKRKK